jgi:outer membrane lipoprotein SlyB
MKNLIYILTIFLLFGLSGCTTRSVVDTPSIIMQTNIAYGTITGVNDVLLQKDSDDMKNSNNSSFEVVTELGILLDTVTGNSSDKISAQELTILLDNGIEIVTTIKQNKNRPTNYAVSDKVKLYYKNNQINKIEFQNRTEYRAVSANSSYKKAASEDMIIIDEKNSSLTHEQIKKIKILDKLQKDGVLTEKEVIKEKIRVLGRGIR